MTVYLDMDGVLADWFGKVEQVYEADHWKQLNMDVVVAEIDKMTKGDWGICSSPLRGDTFNSAYWKRRWLEDRNWIPKNWKDLIFTSNKEKFARASFTGEPNILIDDKLTNVDKWNDAGGIGIRYQANEDPVEYVLERVESSLLS